MRYSDELKNHVLSRLMAGEVNQLQASEQYGASTVTLRAWLKKALAQAPSEPVTVRTPTQMETPMTKLKLPKGVSYLQAYGAVVAKQLLPEAEFGAYCRKHGLTSSAVAAWQRWFNDHPNACNVEDLQSERQLRQRAQSDLAAKKKELARKEKALAETATMLVIAKKAQAIWGAEES